MKKKLLLVVSMIALLVCLLAVCVSAETVLNKQTSNEYGTLSTFDESITVGRTDNQNGFSPYIAETGNTYARVVIGDGTTFYTFPTAYIYSSSRIYGKDGKTLWSYDLTSLNSAMEAATGTNPNWTKENVYRIELPYNTAFLNSDGTQKFYGFLNVIEIYLQPNMTNIDTGSNVNCFFHSCEKLTTIHNIDSFVFKHNNNLSGTFQNCKSLTSLTLGASPNITKINGSMFNNCTNLVSVNVFEAFPNAKEFGSSAFINCNNLKSLSANRCDGVIVFPERFWFFESSAFQNCDSITAVKFTGTSAKLLQSAFHSLDSLEYIYFPRDSKLELPSCEVFSNNASLKAIALPDNCTTLPDRGFKNCASLKAVYLPANVTTFVTNGWDQAPFTSDPELYFVNDWFNVLDESGDFLFESFDMPERPDVYYFPETLSALCTNKTSGTIFLNCYNINPYLVFGTKVTQITVNDGLLINCGTKGETKTAIFLGEMTLVCHSSQDSRLNNIQYVFANPNDKSVADVTITSNNSNTPADSAKIFFCATNSSYKMIGSGGTYGEDLGGAHFVSPNATKTTEATCTTIEGTTYYCFCKKVIKEEKTGEALGHQNSELRDIIYNGANKFFENGDSTYYCERCGQEHVVEKDAAIIFVAKGYTYTESNNPSKAMMQSFAVNGEALNLYNTIAKNNTIVGFGLVAANTSTTEVFENGVAQSNGAVASFIGKTYDVMEMKISGIEKNESYANTQLNCCAYILVNNGESVDSYYATEVLDSDLEGVQVSVTETLTGGASYNQIYGNRNPNVVE